MEKTKNKKWLSVLMALLVIISCTSLVMAAGLTKGSDGKWHYVLSNGNYAKNTWMTVSGSKYYFDGNGNGVTGFYTVSGKKYYFDTSSAKMQKNVWKKNASGKWLYFGTVGEAVNGWLTLNSNKYYFVNYFMVTGWNKISGANYYFDSNGRMQKNCWVSGHYLGSNGKALTGWQTLSGYRYFFDGNGKMYTGLKTVGSYMYYFDTSNGKMLKNAWKSINGNFYYFNGNGEAVKGWQEISGATYYFNGNYVRLSGTQTIDGKVCHLDSDGKAITGWQTINDKTYYYDNHGATVTNRAVIDGYTYYLGNDGVLKTGWVSDGTHMYYAFKHSDSVKYPVRDIEAISKEAVWGDYESPSEYDWQPEGSLIVNHYCRINGNWYFFDGSGARVTGLLSVFGGLNYFDENGVMCTYPTIEVDGELYVHTGFGRYTPADYDSSQDPHQNGNDIPVNG